jgi:hypothetical protein
MDKHDCTKPLTADHGSTPTSLTASNLGTLSHCAMLQGYLQSAQPVDKRMETAEKTTLANKDQDGKVGLAERIDGDVAELDKFMASVTEAALVQQARRCGGGKRPRFGRHSLSLF